MTAYDDVDLCTFGVQQAAPYEQIAIDLTGVSTSDLALEVGHVTVTGCDSLAFLDLISYLRFAVESLTMHIRSSFWPVFQLPARFTGVRFKSFTILRLFVSTPD